MIYLTYGVLRGFKNIMKWYFAFMLTIIKVIVLMPVIIIKSFK